MVRGRVVLYCALAVVAACGSDDGSTSSSAALDQALAAIVARSDGPPGIIVMIQRGGAIEVHTAGVADRVSDASIEPDDHTRVASVAKAFSGAAATALVAEGLLTLDDTIGQWRADLPTSWHAITLRQLLNHTSGIDDFSKEDDFLEALYASLDVAPPPRELLSYVADAPPAFPPGTQYRYSNSDNIIVGLMVEAAAAEPYEDVLAARVFEPLALTRTSLPAGTELPEPQLHGYEVGDPLLDVSEVLAAGWTWASGGIVSTPADMTRFVRGYVSGALTDVPTRDGQFAFIADAHSEPPGPGTNSAGLAVFRYQTRCGTVYGHTGNTAGYTQFIAANEAGDRSVVVSVNAQLVPTSNSERFVELRNIFELGVCVALQ